jgi:hypothetical protein
MLDQNTTTLLAALTGGLLTALGGFLTNCVSERTSKRKEVRNMLEKVYKNLQAIERADARLQYDELSPTTNMEVVLEIQNYMRELELLVDFYLPPLKSSLAEYRTNLASIQEDGLSGEKRGRREKFEIATKKFMASVTTLFKKKGYSYF